MLNFLALNIKKGTNLWLQSSMSFSRTEMRRNAEMGRDLWRSSSSTCSNSLSRLLGAMSILVLNFSKTETPQPLWTTFSSVQLLSQSAKPWTLFELYGIFHTSVCSHGLSSFLCAALQTEKTLVPPSLHHHQVFLHIEMITQWAFSSPSWTNPAYSASLECLMP